MRHTGPLAHLEALLDDGGQIMLGTVRPIVGAAVAHDGRQTLAMLKRRPDETVEQLLQRLDRGHCVRVEGADLRRHRRRAALFRGGFRSRPAGPLDSLGAVVEE